MMGCIHFSNRTKLKEYSKYFIVLPFLLLYSSHLVRYEPISSLLQSLEKIKVFIKLMHNNKSLSENGNFFIFRK
jgi:hypothetical protein